MKLKIRSIEDIGNIQKERVVLKAIAPIDVASYAIVQNKYADKESYVDIFEGYWFPFKKVSDGELVVLYTREGVSKEKDNPSGNKTHFFYWGKKSPVWQRKDVAALLLESEEWDLHPLDGSDGSDDPTLDS